MLKPSQKKFELKNIKRFAEEPFEEDNLPEELEDKEPDSDDRPGRAKVEIETF